MRMTLRLLSILLLPSMVPLPAWAQVTVSGAWVREAPPGVPALAGYLVLHNGGDRPRTLTAIEAGDFAHAMLHRSVTENGVVRMRHVAKFTLAPGQTLRMAPGGYHIMLMHPARPLHAGDSVTLVLKLDNGEQLAVRAPVLRRPPTPP